MAAQKHWIDFIIMPDDINRIQSYAERVGTARAVDTETNGWDQKLHATLVTQEQVAKPGDEFEAMEISERGDVTIWTRERVWYLRHECGVKERLRHLPRHPAT